MCVVASLGWGFPTVSRQQRAKPVLSEFKNPRELGYVLGTKER